MPALRNVGLGQSTADRATPWVTWLDGRIVIGSRGSAIFNRSLKYAIICVGVAPPIFTIAECFIT